MAHWLTAKNGNFNTKADLDTGRVPVFNTKHQDPAILDAAGGAYTVTVTTNEDVKSIQTATNATLSLTGAGTFLANQGTGLGANAGSILVGDGYTLETAGTFDNTGTVALNAAASNSFISVAADLTLTGGGKVILGDSFANGIVDFNMGGGTSLT